jgi:hexosaminidase
MKYLPILILVLSFTCCNSEKNKPGVVIIPKPESVLEMGGFFKLDKNSFVYSAGNAADGLIKIFSDQVKGFVSLEAGAESDSEIEIIIESSDIPEAYTLLVNKKKILITSGTLAGAFNGLQSLRQLIIFSEERNGKLLIPCCMIDDAPRYSWRGIMLDESRHFFGVTKVKQLIDMMALHKLNTFHWHLTDCAGWRLEMKKYPKLTTVGGIGNHSDANAPATYYTQDQIKDIVQYAADRFIQVIPEIDMPGHAASSNRAYPEFSGGGSSEYPEFTFNPGLESTYSYLTDILREVTGLFPSAYIHLGGDEVHFGNEKWNTDKQVKSLMKKHGLKDLKAVEKYFVRRMADTIKNLNRTTIGWDEIVDLNLNPEDAIVMWWRHDRTYQLDSALTKNYKVVLCPRIPLYFDFVQHSSHKYGRRWDGAFSELENVYNFPYDSLFRKEEGKSQVIGIQANLWSEVIHNDKRLDFMTYPRLSALAEAAWANGDSKDYNDFLFRLTFMLQFLKAQEIYYFDPFMPEFSVEPVGPQI